MKVTLRLWKKFIWGLYLFDILVTLLIPLFPSSVVLRVIVCSLWVVSAILIVFRPCPECRKMLAYFNQERCQNCGEKVDRDKEIFRIPTWKEHKEGYRAKFEAWKKEVMKKGHKTRETPPAEQFAGGAFLICILCSEGGENGRGSGLWVSQWTGPPARRSPRFG